MDTLAILTTFFGWCTAINLGLLIFTSLFLVAARRWVSGIHGKMFGLGEEALAVAYFGYLARFKVAVLVFNLVPWIALEAMA